MVKRASFADMDCPIAQSMEVLGEWWSPLILRDTIIFGINRFDELQRSLGIAPNILTKRLHTLVDAGVLERRQYSERPARYEYVPTEAGLALRPVLKALADWGRAWRKPPSADADAPSD